MRTRDIRKKFLSYFQEQGHTVVPSSPTFPHDDPTLLFTNAGMNQFKDIFLSKTTADYRKAASCQKCVRVGGKHNDLENVGHTSRHLTFFEMLGNFSFGDYFKEQAIAHAWYVATEIFGFDKERIYPSVFEEDDEAFSLWEQYVPYHRITKMGAKDNFWAMGDTGPCGPCSELYFDKGKEYGHAKSPLEDSEGIRFLEFWNLVFMQYNRRTDGVQEPLAAPSIDTGAGLERVMSLLHNTESVFETDILRTLITAIEETAKITYDPHNTKTAPAFRTIADHLRCLAFTIADGVQPSNIERGYVLRKVLRRAVRYGKILGFEEPFLGHLLPTLMKEMGTEYPEISVAKQRIEEIITREEEAFFKTLRRGGNLLNQIIETAAKKHQVISGLDAFTLKDTYGLPLEEIQLIAKDTNLTVDLHEFRKLEQEAKARSKSAHKATNQVITENLFQEFLSTHKESLFLREENEEIQGHVVAIITNGTYVDTLHEGSEGMILLDQTTFYPEMGGQVGDTGFLINLNGTFTVTNTTSPYKGIICHQGSLSQGTISLHEKIGVQVNWSRRQAIANNHTATHLLHWALHKVLGEHARQAGSVVNEHHLRFDFSHHKALTSDELMTIEQLVNSKIRENKEVSTYECAYSEVQNRQDIKQFFGDKYGKTVRVVDIEFSKELCGGTHTRRTGNIGYFRILKEGSIAAGVRRIEAVTGAEAEQIAYNSEKELQAIATLIKTPTQKITERLEKMQDEIRALQEEVNAFKQEKRKNIIKSLFPLSSSQSNYFFSVHMLESTPQEIKEIAEEIAKHHSVILVLGCTVNQKSHFFIKVTRDLVQKGIHANELLQQIMQLIGGKGGGNQECAQGAASFSEKVDEAIRVVQKLIAGT